MTEDKIEFQAEVAKLLDIVVNSLYSNKEIFLRELISNASDACDRLRYQALTDPSLIEGEPNFRIELSVDKKARTVTVADNGIGMDRDELIANLGTIARSGTSAFLDSLTGDAKKDSALIGQFGVGFYSSFSVAKSVDVTSRKAGGDTAWTWSSDGKGAFTIDEGTRDGPGTMVVVHLAKGESEYLEEARLRHIVKTYSDHIPVPIVLKTKDGEETVNSASALWMRPKGEIGEDQYREFYHHAAHAFDEPWLTLHNKAEGKIEYTNLLFVPSSRPFDLMTAERKQRIKLYVKRVFITDDCEELLPAYLRFVRGIVDSEDLPLNVSREMLQRNPVVIKIRQALVKRVFGELKKKADKAPEEYARFWENFGAVLKEGLYEDPENRDAILGLARFAATGRDGLISLEDYVASMKPGQKAIYYISGDNAEALAASPQTEGYRARGVAVLLMTDPIDEFWLPATGAYKDTPFKSVTAGAADLGEIEADEDAEKAKDKAEKADDAAIAKLVLAFKQALGDEVKEVRASDRLTESAVCLVAGEGDMDLHLERMLKQHGHLGIAASSRVLEINPAHELIKQLAGHADNAAKQEDIAAAARLLLDQARIVEGETLADPASFARRMTEMMGRNL